VRDDLPGQTVAPAAYTHLASFAIVDRKAFDPLEFTGRGMQPLAAAPAFRAITVQAARPLTAENARALERWTAPATAQMARDRLTYAAAWPQHFDRVIYYHFGDPANFDPSALKTVAEGSFFAILAPQPPPTPQPAAR
jgi:hypothetical protein